MSLLSELKIKYNLVSISEKFIFINIGVFAILSIISTIYFLFADSELGFFYNNLALPENLNLLVYKPWTIFTHFFTHFSFWHLLGNMVALYFFGRIFLEFFNTKQFVSCYLLGGLFAGIIFIASYNVFPALVSKSASLVGASASIFAILFAATAKSPNYIFNLFGILKIPLWVIAVLYTILFISSIPIANSGGEIAHLGGAFLGYFYTKQFNRGKDIARPFEKIVSFFSEFFKKNTNLKTVHKSKTKVGGFSKGEFSEFNKQKRVDVILDKISKSGYDSLSKEEKEFLFRAGK